MCGLLGYGVLRYSAVDGECSTESTRPVSDRDTGDSKINMKFGEDEEVKARSTRV